jgi:hypothetical protein
MLIIVVFKQWKFCSCQTIILTEQDAATWVYPELLAKVRYNMFCHRVYCDVHFSVVSDNFCSPSNSLHTFLGGNKHSSVSFYVIRSPYIYIYIYIYI